MKGDKMESLMETSQRIFGKFVPTVSLLIIFITTQTTAQTQKTAELKSADEAIEKNLKRMRAFEKNDGLEYYRLKEALAVYKKHATGKEFDQKILGVVHGWRSAGHGSGVSRAEEFFSTLKGAIDDQAVSYELFNAMYDEHLKFLDNMKDQRNAAKIPGGNSPEYYEANRKIFLESVQPFTKKEIFDLRAKKFCSQEHGRFDETAGKCKCGMKAYEPFGEQECTLANGEHTLKSKAEVSSVCAEKKFEKTMMNHDPSDVSKHSYSKGLMAYNSMELDGEAGFAINLGVGEFNMYDSMVSYFVTSDEKGPVYTDSKGKRYFSVSDFVKAMEAEPIRVKSFKDGKVLDHIIKPQFFQRDMEENVKLLTEKLHRKREACAAKSSGENFASLVKEIQAPTCSFNGASFQTRYVCKCKFGEFSSTGVCEKLGAKPTTPKAIGEKSKKQ